MAEVINLRQARKRAERRERERKAEENRLTHGEAKRMRKQREAESKKVARDLDAHKLRDEK